MPLVLEHEQRLLAAFSEAEFRALADGLAKLEAALGLVQHPDQCS